MSYLKINDRCTGCLACVHNCPAGALAYVHEEDTRVLLHNLVSCARCGNCWRICPEEAIEFRSLLEGKWEEVTALKCLKCSICGEPVFTVDHQKTLKKKLHQEAEILCPLHKASTRADSWRRAAMSGSRRGGAPI